MANKWMNQKKLGRSFLAIVVSCAFSSLGTAYEVSPMGRGLDRSSEFQMQQAQEAIRNICGCVVGNQTLNPNCGPLTAAALQTPNLNPMGMPFGNPMMPGQPGMMPGVPGATPMHNAPVAPMGTPSPLAPNPLVPNR